MSLKFQQIITNHVILDNTLDDEISGYLDVELIKLAINIKRQVILVLDPWYKKLNLVSSFIGHDIDKLIINEYDEKSLLLMLLKCYEHSHQIFIAPDNS